MCIGEQKLKKRADLSEIISSMVMAVYLLVMCCITAVSFEKKLVDDSSRYFLVFLLFLMTLVFSYCLSAIYRKTKILACLALFLYTLVYRLFYLTIMGVKNAKQISDFASCFELAKQSWGVMGDKGVIFPNWGAWPIWIKFLTVIFGFEHEWQYVIVNVLLFCVSVVMVFLACIIYGCSERHASIAASVLCIWPALAEYSIICSPEWVCIFFNSIALLGGYFVLNQGVKSNIKRYFACVFCTCLVTIAGFFKALDLIIIISFIVVLFIHELRSETFAIRRIITTVLVIIATMLITKFLGNSLIKSSVGHDINPSPYVYYMAIGLNKDTMGAYSKEIASNYVQNIRQTDFDFNQVNASTLNNLLTKIKSEKYLTVDFFKAKILRGYGIEIPNGFNLKTMSGNCEYMKYQFGKYLGYAWNIWYKVILFLLCFSGVCALIKRKQGLVLFSVTVFIGMFLLTTFLTETQPRYKCVIYPYCAILVGYAIDEGTNMIMFLGKRFTSFFKGKICKQ